MISSLLKMIPFVNGFADNFETSGMLKIAIGVGFLNIFATFVFPDLEMLTWMIVAVLADFLTGLLKVLLTAGFKGIRSDKAKRSVAKVFQYVGLIVFIILLTNSRYVADHKIPIDFIVNALCSLMVIIELISIVENFRDMDPKSEMSKYVFAPILRWLRFKRSKTVDEVNAAAPGNLDAPVLDMPVPPPPIIDVDGGDGVREH